jgi:hypothetical protein
MSRSLAFSHQLSLILYVCLVVPKENNRTLQKHPILFTIIPEIEVNLKICGPEKPTCMTTMSALHNGSICNEHVHSCSHSSQIHSIKFRAWISRKCRNAHLVTFNADRRHRLVDEHPFINTGLRESGRQVGAHLPDGCVQVLHGRA